MDDPPGPGWTPVVRMSLEEVVEKYGKPVTSIDPWPNEAEMAEMCGCMHMLGQHAYGDERSPCDICPCHYFHLPSECPGHGENTHPIRSLWKMEADQLLAEIIDWGDAYGCLANAQADDLRNALHQAAIQLRSMGWRPPGAAPPRPDPSAAQEPPRAPKG